jgi:hypothetical protein
MGTFKHVDDIVLFGNLLFLYLQDVWIQAKFAFPERFIRLKLSFDL